MPRLINWELVKNPYNWAIVWLMIAFGLIGIGLVKPVTLESITTE